MIPRKEGEGNLRAMGKRKQQGYESLTEKWQECGSTTRSTAKHRARPNKFGIRITRMVVVPAPPLPRGQARAGGGQGEVESGFLFAIVFLPFLDFAPQASLRLLTISANRGLFPYINIYIRKTLIERKSPPTMESTKSPILVRICQRGISPAPNRTMV
jgi:hypothetical protein